MPIGDLRERVTVERRTDSVSAAGAVSWEWEDYAKLWGRMKPVREREPMIAGRPKALATWRLTIRWRDDLTTSDRVEWNGQTFDITGIVNADERKRYLTLDLIEAP